MLMWNVSIIAEEMQMSPNFIQEDPELLAG